MTQSSTYPGSLVANVSMPSRDLFIIYADRKLLTPVTIARIEAQFHLPTVRTEIKSTETPNGLDMIEAALKEC
jgi:hypothetical protein